MPTLSITFDSMSPAKTRVRIDDEAIGRIQKIQVTPESTTVVFPAAGSLSDEDERYVQNVMGRLNQFVGFHVERE